ncbi:MAG: hypothetical protein K1X94_09180 [Sandaracinaceae bacterium]|nr:hypothetical protein [Sandaracinaceae bacterium]
MRARALSAVFSTAMLCGAPALIGCEPVDPPGGSYYQERVEPFFTNSCVRQNGPCHVTNERGVAMGNLDVTSFDALMRRRDALEAFGPYPVSLVLLKAGEQREMSVFSMNFDGPRDADPPAIAIRTDVQHAGGRILTLSSDSYNLLSQWSRQGHTRTGAPPTHLQENLGECTSQVGHAPGFVPGSIDTSSAHFAQFRDRVQPMLARRCAGSSCHGSPVVDLFISCGDTPEQLEWNYWVAMEFVAPGTARSTSELLRRPLAVQVGGSFHEGGDVFGSVEPDVEPDYDLLAQWVEAAPESAFPAPFPASLDDDGHGSERGFRFFVERVQPILVRSGCAFQNCHSTTMFHDLRLRGGSNGVFGHLATVRNYQIARDMLALDSADPNESRLIAKNLLPPSQEVGGEGITHRGGALFETFPPDVAHRRPNFATVDDCAMVDSDAGDLGLGRDAAGYVHPYCVIVRWHQIEREELLTAARLPSESLQGIVYVERPSGATGGGGRPDDFDTFRPGARLVLRELGLDASNELTALGAETDLGAGCGFGASVDIRGPAVTWDGTRVGFSARTSEGRGFRLYEVNVDGTGCAEVSGLPPTEDVVSGIRIHDFDPAYAADGRLVFASTRGYLTAEAVGVAGPTRTTAQLAPNSNLYVLESSGLRQLTFLLNQEFQPSFMTDGRIIMTAEKRETDFHQFATRRENLDGGDYHPLFGQRTSVGFDSVTEVVEGLDRNFVMVGAPMDPTNGVVDGAGHIIIVNRSIGPDQAAPRDPEDRAYIPSRTLPVSDGVFRSPAPLPNGLIVASCAAAAPVTNWDLCVIDPRRGPQTMAALDRLLGSDGTSELEAVAVVARAPRPVFVSKPDEANGHTEIRPGRTDADILISDFPMIATLVFENTRNGRHIADAIGGFRLLEAHPPPVTATSFDGLPNVVTDSLGRFYAERTDQGFVSLEPDGSALIRIRGGMAMQLLPTDATGTPLMFGEGAPVGSLGMPYTGQMLQRETMQFYPGENSRQSIPRNFFNSLCGGCHGSISGREIDVVSDVDILTRASPNIDARGTEPVDLR